MNITLRLYKRHDLDLIPIITDPSFKLTKQIKAAVRAYLSGEPFRIPIEHITPADREKGTYLLHICVNREKEPDLFAFVTSLKAGKRNSALKNLLRYYLDTVYLGEYLNDKGLLRHPCNIPIADKQMGGKPQTVLSHKVEYKKTTVAEEKESRPGAKDAKHPHPIATEKRNVPNERKAPDAGRYGAERHNITPHMAQNKATEDTDGGFDFMSQMEGLMGSI